MVLQKKRKPQLQIQLERTRLRRNHFAGSVTRGIQKASLTTKFLLVIAVLETGFALIFCNGKEKVSKKKARKSPKITA